MIPQTTFAGGVNIFRPHSEPTQKKVEEPAGPTARDKLLEVLTDKPVTIDVLSAKLGLTKFTTYEQLRRLLAEGLVQRVRIGLVHVYSLGVPTKEAPALVDQVLGIIKRHPWVTAKQLKTALGGKNSTSTVVRLFREGRLIREMNKDGVFTYCINLGKKHES